ncbi:hypothetical protein [Subtercola sp. RTI3]|uniref:hypothetical protein n=1 Tax=Subtercola sp. RTI3 TaxID=3048639 RepID=UPI002B233334|nr:hypothetical protein [Subtercola sp. RTI3]MEA9984102.1 hypothetical protein [Subtercola sp. RTI3]
MTPALTTDWFANAAAHDDFLARFTSAYRGRHQALDALWWNSHPETAAPSGALAPARRLPALQRTVFARPVHTPFASTPAAADSAEAALDLQSLERELAGDRLAFDLALAHALKAEHPEPSQASAPHVPANHGGPAPTTSVCGDHVPPSRPAAGLDTAARHHPATPAQRRRTGRSARHGDALARWGVLAALVVAVFLAAGSLASAAISRATAGASSSAFASTGASTGAGSAATAPATASASAADAANSYAVIFTHAQIMIDVPPLPLQFPSHMVPDSFRALSRGEFSNGSAYAAHDVDGNICLVVYGNASDYATSCASEAAVAAGGLQLSMSTSAALNPSTHSVDSATVDLLARWNPDGSFTIGTTARR